MNVVCHPLQDLWRRRPVLTGVMTASAFITQTKTRRWPPYPADALRRHRRRRLGRVQADPALRGVRYPPHIEAATWYVLSEALTNVAKHANASQVVVSLRQPNHQLVVEVRDDGCGFNPAGPRGLGLAGLADRMDILGGELQVHSSAGEGTAPCAQIPLTEPEVARA